jgi:hypothetical protein
MARRQVRYVVLQLAKETDPRDLAESYSELRDSIPIFKFLEDFRRRRPWETKYDYYANGRIAECIATNGMRAIYLSVDRVTRDEADRIVETMKAITPIEIWDESRFHDVLKAILGEDYATKDVP